MDIRNIQFQLRPRRMDEIFEFALLVLRNNSLRFARLFFIECLIFGSLNALILFWYQYITEDRDYFSWFHLLMLWIVFVERTVFQLPLVIYNGNLLFAQRPRFRDVLKGSMSLVPRYLWQQAVVRPIYLFLFLWTILLPWRSLVTHFFKSEVLLLERLQGAGVRQRLSAITSGQAERTIGFLFIDVILFVWFMIVAAYCWNTLLGVMELNGRFWWLDAEYFSLLSPINHFFLFFFFIYHSVAKFLYYIDTRSLREGWDVELTLVRGIRETEEALGR